MDTTTATEATATTAARGGDAKLRLRADDSEDLAVVAACLQDARVPLREMAYLHEERRFVAALTRFRREVQEDPASCEGLTECLTALVVDEVEDVKYRGIDPAEADRELMLLTVATHPGRDRLVHIELVFEGDARIQLRTDKISCRMDDFGEPVLSRTTPCDHFGTALPGWTESYAGPS